MFDGSVEGRTPFLCVIAKVAEPPLDARQSKRARRRLARARAQLAAEAPSVAAAQQATPATSLDPSKLPYLKFGTHAAAVAEQLPQNTPPALVERILSDAGARARARGSKYVEARDIRDAAARAADLSGSAWRGA